jgi:hypothetical protein
MSTGKGWGKNQINWITEIQVGTFQVGTQLDSIGHIQIGNRFYNGWTTRDVVESWGVEPLRHRNRAAHRDSGRADRHRRLQGRRATWPRVT